MTLHLHAGHSLTIGHPGNNPTRSDTTLWCDTCDAVVIRQPTGAPCSDDHIVPQDASTRAPA